MAKLCTDGENIENLSEENLNIIAELEKQLENERGEDQPESILVRGALLQCSCGTHCRKLNLSMDYGVYVENMENPKVHEKNCKVGDDKNISYYGICKSSNPPTDVENICLEPYVWPDGTVASDSNENGPQCKPCILGQWFNPVEDEKIQDLDDCQTYQGISTGSFLVCKYGGIIIPRTSGQS